MKTIKQFSLFLLSDRISFFFFGVGFLFVFLTALTNPGVIALDDYYNGTRVTISAQNQPPLSTYWKEGGVHPKLPQLFLYSLGQLSYLLKIEDPFHQLQFCLILIGCLNFLMACFAAWILFQTESILTQKIALFLVSFFCFSPLFFSRLMNESLSIFWVLLSFILILNYQRTKQILSLFFATMALSIGSLFRFQIGTCLFCILILFLLPCQKKEYPKNHFFFFLLFALFGFILTGCIDIFLSGGFHKNLYAYLLYNMEAGKLHGTSPFYVFPLVFLGLSFPPSLFGKYGLSFWKNLWRNYLVLILFFFSFLIPHTFSPHKEERFLIPIFPIFLFLLVPFWRFWIEKNIRWRVFYALSLNCILLFLISFNTPQKNMIYLVRDLGKTKEIKNVVGLGETFVFFPEAFSLQKLNPTDLSLENLSSLKPTKCDTAIAIRKTYLALPTFESWVQDYQLLRQYDPAILESFVVWANPKMNARRGSITLFLPKNCPRPAIFR